MIFDAAGTEVNDDGVHAFISVLSLSGFGCKRGSVVNSKKILGRDKLRFQKKKSIFFRLKMAYFDD